MYKNQQTNCMNLILLNDFFSQNNSHELSSEILVDQRLSSFSHLLDPRVHEHDQC